MKHYKLLAVIPLAAILVAGVNASAITLLDTTSYNGHTYELWSEVGISWEGASDEAANRGGYLATFTDEAETLAVYNAFIGEGFFQATEGQGSQAWLGGFTTAPNFSTTDPAAWEWVTGEEWTQFDIGNWGGQEPNGDSKGLAINRFGTPKWNDEGGFVGGYIVEIGRGKVPDAGSSFALLSSALAFLGLVGRKFRE